MLAAALVATAASGCGAPGPREDDAVTAARAFEASLAAAQYAQACTLLAPQTREEVAGEEDCAGALAKEELPSGRGQAQAQVYGRQAMVRLVGDTLFLSQFDKGWKVTAAGCTPRSDQPYDCQVKGG
ncbi:hypothetical protein [Streptomyces sp. NRRL S-87]|uniref:hypothetical protein n=1 Tax=Streptomyces sp. NRRL S-87 TaxID=1463920 RepID=UPI0004BFF35B|nr:hypothetical protein [Streptomyces sp. NRRL S-87]